MNNVYSSQIPEHDVKLTNFQLSKDGNLKQHKLSNNQSSIKNIKKNDSKINE